MFPPVYMNFRAFLVAFALALEILFHSPKALARVELGLGSDLTIFKYEEVLQAPKKSSETAAFGTMAAQARWYFTNESNLQLRGDVITNVASRYDGSDFNTGAPVQSVNTLGFATVEADLYIAITDNFLVYAGYGSRSWSRFLSGSPGYRELYTWNYTPLGVLAWIVRTASFDIGADVSARPTSGGKIKVITSETTSGGQDSQMDLGGKTGYRLAVPSRIRVSFMGPNVNLNATLWYEHSEIGQSQIVPNATLAPDPGSGIMEPSSKTDQMGLDLIMGYSF
jgi:hypothetical protein